MKPIYTSNWEKWKELCEYFNENPYVTCEFGVDEGGGNSTDFEYIGDTPERED